MPYNKWEGIWPQVGKAALIVFSVGLSLLGAMVVHASQNSGAAATKTLGVTDTHSSDMDNYLNVKYGFSVDYPKRLLSPQGESAAGDGQKFLSKDQTFKMVVSGNYNKLRGSVADECEASIRNGQKQQSLVVTYKVEKDSSWCVFSGIAGNIIVYQKTILQNDRLNNMFKTIRLEYPVSDKKALDSVVQRIVASFQSYEHLTAKVSGVDLETREIDLEVEDESWNESTVCKFNSSEGKRFASVRIGQTVTVAGFSHNITLRSSSVETSGLFQHVIANCTLPRQDRQDRTRER